MCETGWQMIQVKARSCPELIAVRHGERHVSYGELMAAVQSAGRGLRAHGAGPGSVVGVYGERGVDVVVGMLAAWWAGAAYLPLDRQQPPERSRLMADDAQVDLILAAGPVPDGLAEGRTLVPIGGNPDGDGDGSDERHGPGDCDPADLAYVIYTSGSTGRPKGVMVTHASVAHYLRWAGAAYRADTGEGLLHSSIGVDLTVTALLAPLAYGRTVVVAPPGWGVAPIAAALDRIDEFAFLKLTPTHLGLLDEETRHRPSTDWSGYLVVGGELLTAELLAGWRAYAPNSTVVNEYGPTETTVACAINVVPIADLPDRGPVPIGQGAPDVELLVLDDDLQPVAPPGVGELYIAGPGLARGYIRQPAATAGRFIADPQGGGRRLYRTGDVVEITGTTVTFRGRSDHQVKVAGHRVELGEIEQVLRDCPGVAGAVVVFGAAEQELVAFVRLERPDEGAFDELDRYLSQRLPTHMMPELTMWSQAWPETSSGKIDRHALLSHR